MANTVNFANLAANFGAYCLEVAPTLDQWQLYQSLQSIESLGIRLVTGIRDRMQFAIPYSKSVLQQGGGVFNPTNNAIDFVALEWQMRGWRVNTSFDETSFDATFLQHYKSASRSADSSIALVEFMLAMVIKKLKEDLEIAIWQGVYDPVKVANAAAPLKVLNGFLKLVADAIAAVTTVPIVTGAITNVNAVTAFTDMWKGLTDKTISLPSVTYASPRNVIKFVENYTAIGGENNLVINFVMQEWLKANGNIDNLKLPAIPLPVSGGLNMIVPVWGMGNSSRLITTSRINGGMMAVGMGDENDLARLKTDNDHYNVDTMIDGSVSCNMGAFSIDGEQYTRVNDQA